MSYEDGKELYQGIKNYIHFYNAAPIRVLISSVPMKYFIRRMWLKEFVYICKNLYSPKKVKRLHGYQKNFIIRFSKINGIIHFNHASFCWREKKLLL